jgi:tetratricopeptide (TPR) repeat protein
MMMKKTILLGLVILGLLVIASTATAQSLLDNPDYKKAVELQRQAEAAYAEGDYDRAREYSRQAKEYIEKSNTYVDERLLIYRANSLLKAARERVSYFKSVGVQPEYQGYLDQAEKDLALAQASYDAGRYEESIEYSRKVLAGIAVMKTVQQK